MGRCPKKREAGKRGIDWLQPGPFCAPEDNQGLGLRLQVLKFSVLIIKHAHTEVNGRLIENNGTPRPYLKANDDDYSIGAIMSTHFIIL